MPPASSTTPAFIPALLMAENLQRPLLRSGVGMFDSNWDVLGAKGRFSFDCKWYACLKSNYEFDNTFDSANLWKDLKGRYNNLKDGLKELVGLHRRSADTIVSILSQPFMERAQLIL